MRKLLLSAAILLSVNCFAQKAPAKDSITKRFVVVYFPDSASYIQFTEFLGSIPSKQGAPYYTFFSNLPAEYKYVTVKYPAKK